MVIAALKDMLRFDTEIWTTLFFCFDNITFNHV